MKNIFIIILLSLTLILSCSKENKQQDNKEQENITFSFDSTSLKTTVIDNAEEQYFFMRYKFIPGESFRYRLTTISERSQSIVTDSTMNDKMGQTIIFIINFKTLSVDKDSVAELQCTFSSINLKANAQGRDITYQSGTELDTTDRIRFAEYESYINNPFNIRVGKQGEILDIYMIDKIINRFLELRKLADSLTAQEKVMVSQELTNSSIKPILSQIFREVPADKMAKDSTWSYKRESLQVMVFKVDYENKYKIDNLEMLGDDKIAVISGSIKTNVNGKSSFTEQGVSYKFEKPISTANGKIYFNLDKGRIQKSRSQSEMKNAYQMEQGIKKARAKEESSNVNILELL
ncbi:MAG: hypothetical protein IPM14_15845 [bacterium]|nr:hypothetical protein [bacterium]